MFESSFDDLFFNEDVQSLSPEEDIASSSDSERFVGLPSSSALNSEVPYDNDSFADELKIAAGYAFQIPSSLRRVIEGRRITYLDFDELPPNKQLSMLKV